MADPKLRLFFALWPDSRTRAAIAALAGQVAAQTGGRATAPDNVHLTLAFLGAQPRDSVAALAAAATAAALDASSFVLTLDHDTSLGAEGYRLDSNQQLKISAPTDTGVFYGTKTL